MTWFSLSIKTLIAVILNNASDYQTISDCRVRNYRTNEISHYKANKQMD